jgi:hypothetical protein
MQYVRLGSRTTICWVNLTAAEGASAIVAAMRRQTRGGNVTRPRAADDFATIRARLEELRRERAEQLTDQKEHSAIGPRPYYRVVSRDAEHQFDRLLFRSVGRVVR